MCGMALFGLVVAGGKSARMGRDKGLIVYYDRPHREWLADLLAPVCDAVYISVNADQARAGGAVAGVRRYPFVVDDGRFDPSPLGALLSADARHPGAGWVLLSCDLAYFDAHCLDGLLAARNESAAGVAYRIVGLDQPHPLAALYEAGFVARLPEIYAAGERSLRRAFALAGALMIDAKGTDCTRGVDTPEEMRRARAALKGRGT
jgi:molybdopterin-guanine dinucleotide biosynthesis protein A